jgi:ankyrin repeat protein
MDITHHLDRLKESFLWAASKGGRTQECQSLLTMGADVNWSNKGEGGTTPILEAAKNGHREVVRLLMAMGADTGVRTDKGDNLMHLAARRGDGEMCAMLADARCEVTGKNER